MVKRILALSLLMVGLAACGSGGGASAEADTLFITDEDRMQKCNCSNAMYTKQLKDPRLFQYVEWGEDIDSNFQNSPLCEPHGEKTRLCLDTLNSLRPVECICAVRTWSGNNRSYSTTNFVPVDSTLCKYGTWLLCHDNRDLCTTIQPQWSTPNVGWFRCYNNKGNLHGFRAI